MTSRDAIQDTFCLLTGAKRLNQVETIDQDTREIIRHQRPSRRWLVVAMVVEAAFILIMVF